MGKKRKNEKRRKVWAEESLTIDIFNIEDDILPLLDDYFNRKFHYNCQANENYISDIPLNCDAVWEVDDLQEIKQHLNEAKNHLSSLDIKVWHAHTQARHRGGRIVPFVKQYIRPELCTQAWCKFHEILCSFPHLVQLESKSFNSFHLCEAPGAFVASLNHYLISRNYKGEWKWKGSTLNPMYEENNLLSMIDVDDFIQETIEHWSFGADDTGDITVLENIEHLKRICSEYDMSEIHLVTCDGSIDCANNPGDQESIVYQLHLCEVVTAVSLLCEGGCMVLKVFTMFESSSVSFMYLLSILFKQLTVHKPVTSKPGNSELYVICSHFIGISTELLQKLKSEIKSARYMHKTQLFPRKAISNSFLADHVNCCKKFAEWQHSTITSNLESFSKKTKKERCDDEDADGDDDDDDQSEFNYIQQCFLSWYCNLCNLKCIKSSRHITKNKCSPFSSKRYLMANSGSKFRHIGTLLERKAKLASDTLNKLSMIEKFDIANSKICISSELISLDVDPTKLKPVYGRSIRCINSSKFANKNVLANFLDFIESDLIKSNRKEESNNNLSDAMPLQFDLSIFSSIQKTKFHSYYFSTDERLVNCVQAYLNNNDSMQKIKLLNDVNKTCFDANDLIQIECLGDLSDEDMINILIEAKHIHTLFTLLKNFHTGSSLLLLMGCPLTRILAQIYRILVASFQRVDVYICEQSAYIYVVCFSAVPIDQSLFSYLSSLRYSDGCDQVIDDHDDEDNDEDNDRNYSLLSFLPLVKLYDSHVFEKLHEINNTFMKHRVNLFIDILNKCVQL